MDVFTNFWVSFLCCILLYGAGVAVIRVRTPPGIDYNPAYLTWLKWNLILCPLVTWPAFGILLALLFPGKDGLLAGLL